MRLFAVIDSFVLGGAETQLATVLNHLAEARGYDCLACSLHAPRETEVAFSDSVQRTYLGKRTRFALPGLFRKLVRMIDDFEPDIVYSRLPLSNAVTRLAALASRTRPRHIAGIDTVPAMYTVDYSLRHPGNILFRQLERHCDLVVCSSEGIRQAVLSHGYPASRLRVIPNGIDMERFRPPSAVPPEPPVRLVTVCSLRREKGVETLIEVLAPLLRGGTVHLAIVGEGERRVAVERITHRLGLTSGVTLHGALRDVRPVLHASHIYVSTAAVEGFGISVAEAAACGLPVIAYDAPGGLREVVVDGVTGRLIAPDHPDAFVEAVERLLPDRSLRECMGRAGRDYVSRHFSIAEVLDNLEACFRML